jgi:hypothetical protein
MAMSSISAAGQALGFGRTGVAAVSPVSSGGLGDMLSNQVTDETDEEKLRRKMGLSVTQSGASPAMQSLLGVFK